MCACPPAVAEVDSLSDRSIGILFGVSVSCLGMTGVVGEQGGGSAGWQASWWPVGGQQAGRPVGVCAVGWRAGRQAGGLAVRESWWTGVHVWAQGVLSWPLVEDLAVLLQEFQVHELWVASKFASGG